jgi:hypothetical protein
MQQEKLSFNDYTLKQSKTKLILNLDSWHVGMKFHIIFVFRKVRADGFKRNNSLKCIQVFAASRINKSHYFN